jgi:pimeloyl-[acyl-carrier protein] methyl ester esterase
MLLVEALAGTGLKPAGLILVGVPAVFCRREDYPWGQPPAAVRAMRRALQKEARKVLEDFASACLATPEAAFAEEAKSLFGCNPEKKYLVAGLDYLLTADLRPLLTMLPVSPVIVQGEKDRVVPPEQARYLFECLPGSQLVILSDTGHLPFVTQAAKFNEIVKATTVGDKGQGPR